MVYKIEGPNLLSPYLCRHVRNSTLTALKPWNLSHQPAAEFAHQSEYPRDSGRQRNPQFCLPDCHTKERPWNDDRQ